MGFRADRQEGRSAARLGFRRTEFPLISRPGDIGTVEPAPAPNHTWGATGTVRIPKTMRVTINGETRELPAPISLDALLRELEIDPGKVALERNLEIVAQV